MYVYINSYKVMLTESATKIYSSVYSIINALLYKRVIVKNNGGLIMIVMRLFMEAISLVIVDQILYLNKNKNNI